MASKDPWPRQAKVRVYSVLALFLLPNFAPYCSADALDHWHWRNPRPNSLGVEDLAFGQSRFIGVGRGGWILSSTDQQPWSTTYMGLPVAFKHVSAHETGFFALGYSGSASLMLTSPDGLQWSSHDSPEAVWMVDAAFAGGIFVGVGPAQTRNGGPAIATSKNGRDWTTLALPSLPTLNLRGVAHGNGRWIAVGDLGLILVSPDGADWTTTESSTTRDLADVAFGGDRFVAIGNGSDSSVALMSPDGIEWTTTLSENLDDPGASANFSLKKVSSGPPGFVAIGGGSSAMFSPDGRTWTRHPLGHEIVRGGVAFGNGQWVAAGLALTPSHAFTTALLTSIDGMHWTDHTAGVPAVTQNGLAFGNGVYVAAGAGGRIARSTNSEDWTLESELSPDSNPTRAAYVDGRFLILGAQGNKALLLVSDDGRNWTDRAPVLSANLIAAASGNGRSVVVAGANVVLSTNGYDWSVSPSTSASNLLDVVFDGTRFVAAGRNGTIQTSPDGTTWTTSITPTNSFLRGLAHDGSTIVAVGRSVILVSTNARDWSVSHTGEFNLLSVIHGGGWFVATGPSTDTLASDVLLTSTDGRQWTRREIGASLIPRCLAFDGRSFLLGGEGGVILQSDPLATPVLPSLALRRAEDLELILTGDSGRKYWIESSENLENSGSWNPLTLILPESNSVRRITMPSPAAARQFYRARLEP